MSFNIKRYNLVGRWAGDLPRLVPMFTTMVVLTRYTPTEWFVQIDKAQAPHLEEFCRSCAMGIEPVLEAWA